jgi:hypothetical protein
VTRMGMPRRAVSKNALTCVLRKVLDSKYPPHEGGSSQHQFSIQ